MVACIRQKSASEVKKAADSANYGISSDYLNWAPVVDKNFLHDTPRNLRSKQKFKNASLMISFNSQEAASHLAVVVKSYGLMVNVSEGISLSFFKAFLTKLAHRQNSE